MTTIVVTGATGSVGGQVVAQLAGRGLEVRAVARNARALGDLARRHGVEPYVADLTAPDSLAPAVDGAHAVFLVFPSVAGDAVAAETVAELGRAPRIVYLSAIGLPPDTADTSTGILGSHALLERLIRHAAKEWTFLRAGGFATNTLAWAGQIHLGDEVRWFGPRIARPLVHEADLAAAGIRALLDEGHQGAVYELTGPERVTQEQQVAAIGAALGRPLRFVDVGEEGAVALFDGVPHELARDIIRAQLAMMDDPEPVTTDVPRLLGRPARTYAQWARDHVADFR
jgi:uncharacterized protein YbjT (DUF2867 family)